MPSILKQGYFHNEQEAFTALENLLWEGGKPSRCPHCGGTEKLSRLPVQRSKASKRNPEGKPVYGLWKCYDCRGQFTVRKGTIFEESRLELHLWFQAAYLLCSSKKGCSANQLSRTLGVTVKTAWFLAHRIREAMREGDLAVPFGSGGGSVQSDETYIGVGRIKGKRHRSYKDQMRVLTLIDNTTGKARSRVLTEVNADTINAVLSRNMAKEARLMTDEAKHYLWAKWHFAGHAAVNHSKEEYVRDGVTVNACEGYFALFKRGMKGVYQHCEEKHLHRYLAEFDFRYNHRVAKGVDDVSRTVAALAGAKGKRLTYRISHAARA
jgi:transposase-like protein